MIRALYEGLSLVLPGHLAAKSQDLKIREHLIEGSRTHLWEIPEIHNKSITLLMLFTTSALYANNLYLYFYFFCVDGIACENRSVVQQKEADERQ